VKVIRTEIPDVLVLEPKVFGDARGFFLESYNKRAFQAATGLDVEFVQDNHSSSRRGVLRGLHYQIRQAQGKLVRVIAGEVFDVAVDLRRSSATFGRSVAFNLDTASRRMAWIPAGFAHGFLVLSDQAEVLYKTTDYYAPSTSVCCSGTIPPSASAGRCRRAGPRRARPPRRDARVRRDLRLRILLIGKNGQVGSALLGTLPALGEVLAADRTQLDLANPGSIRAAVRAARPQVIVNAAAYTAVDQAEREEAVAFMINAQGPAVLAEEAAKGGAILVHFSTDYVFDGEKRTP
jgi:dTDP-4-dehydrorhamnose 3,5-epimerase